MKGLLLLVLVLTSLKSFADVRINDGIVKETNEAIEAYFAKRDKSVESISGHTATRCGDDENCKYTVDADVKAENDSEEISDFFCTVWIKRSGIIGTSLSEDDTECTEL